MALLNGGKDSSTPRFFVLMICKPPRFLEELETLFWRGIFFAAMSGI